MLPALISILITIASSSPTLSEAPVAQIASHAMSMNNRYANTFVNDVFKDNILLTLHYFGGEVKSASDINWKKIESDYRFEFTLNPGEEFAFHDKIAKQYAGNLVKVGNAHFNYTDGFKSDGYLTGDGVCHLASLVYWVAKDAGLEAIAPANHNFANIPDVPRQYGVSIYTNPYGAGGESQNLYITNTKDKPVIFVFDYHDTNLTVSVVEK